MDGKSCWDRWNGDGPVDDREMEAFGWTLPGVIVLVILIIKALNACGVHLHL